jgi:hypothetical protein
VGPDTWDCTADLPESLGNADRATIVHAVDSEGAVTLDGVLARALLDSAPEWVRIHASIHPLTVTIVPQARRPSPSS